MSYPELADAVRAYFKRNENVPMASSDVFADQFSDQDKVRFQLVFSNMALKPPHEMIKLQDGAGTRNVKWRLRVPSDPPFVEPVKATRAKRVEVVDRPLASTASAHISKVSHRSIGNVAETPPEVRAREVNETMPVEHRALTPPPPNNALAAALAKAVRLPNPTVAQFANKKDLQYEIPAEAKVLEVPRGVSGLNPKAHGSAKLPEFEVAAAAEPQATYVDPDLDIKATTSQKPQASKATASTPLKLADPILSNSTELPSVTVPNGTLPEQTPGQILDLFVKAIGPMFQSMITNAVKDALHAHAQTTQAPPAQPAAREAGPSERPKTGVQPPAPAAIVVPPYEDPAPPAPKHKAVMPQDAAAMVKTRLPRVTVIGLPKPQWEFDVKERFKKWLDIRTVHADARGKTARDWCKGSDHVILMVDYNSHTMEQSLKNAPDAIQYERLPGGPSKLDERLRQIIASYTQQAA